MELKWLAVTLLHLYSSRILRSVKIVCISSSIRHCRKKGKLPSGLGYIIIVIGVIQTCLIYVSLKIREELRCFRIFELLQYFNFVKFFFPCVCMNFKRVIFFWISLDVLGVCAILVKHCLNISYWIRKNFGIIRIFMVSFKCAKSGTGLWLYLNVVLWKEWSIESKLKYSENFAMPSLGKN